MTLRLAVWSGPRNLSTALMRAWEHRSDTAVLDEPLYAHYLAATGLDHPGRDEILAAGPTEAAEAVDRCLRPAQDEPVSYQKHMSHHLLPELGTAWLDELRHVLLIRHPVEVLASYTRVRQDVTLEDIGLPQQLGLLDRAELILDATDFLADPEAHLRALCDLVGLAFTDAMLSWPAGPRDSDGVWAPHWYAAVEASTGFGPPRVDVDHEALRAGFPPALQALADEATTIYAELAARRLVL